MSANLGKGEADVSARFSGWKLTKGALKELEISFTYRHKSGVDAVFDALLDAYINDTPLEFAVTRRSRLPKAVPRDRGRSAKSSR